MSAKFTARRMILAGLCEKAAATIPAKDALTVLTCFKIDVQPGQIIVTGSDIEQFMTATSPAVVTTDTFTVALPARKLLAILREAPEGDIHVTVDGPFAAITSAGVAWDLRVVDPAEFPAIPAMDPATCTPVSREEFLAALRAVRHAICKDGARPAHRCADISSGHVTASDGQRLMRVRLDCPTDLRIPAAGVEHLLRLLGSSEAGKIAIAENDQWLFFEVGSTVFGTKKLMARFPDVEKLILAPALRNDQELAVPRAKLAEAIRRVRINADADNSVALRLARGKVTVSSKDKNGNAAVQEVDATWDHGERLVVVQHVFLAEMLSVWPHETCWLRFAPDSTKKKSLILMSDGRNGKEATRIGVLQQLHAAYLGYT